jgi:hypothetical protein
MRGTLPLCGIVLLIPRKHEHFEFDAGNFTDSLDSIPA